MKKLKRRLSAAFRSGSNNNVSIGSSGGGSYYDSECDTRSMVIGYGMMSAPVHNRCWTPLSESMSHLSDKLAVDGTIMEECIDPATLLRVSRGGTAGRRYDTNVNYLGGMHHHPSAPPSTQSHHYQPPPRTHSLYYPRGYSGGGRNSYYGSNACEFLSSIFYQFYGVLFVAKCVNQPIFLVLFGDRILVSRFGEVDKQKQEESMDILMGAQD